MAHLSMSLLGPLQITLSGDPVTGFESDKARALLAYLAAEAPQPHRRDSLAGLLWPEWPDRAARKNLRNVLANLRKVIRDRSVSGDGRADFTERGSSPFLLVTRETIQFNADSDHWLDVTAFRSLIEAEYPTIQQLEEAVAMYRGPFLEGFFLKDSAAFEDWSLLVRERIQRQALEALHRLAEHHEQRGEYERAQTCAWRQVELAPWYEEAHQQLMRALAFSNQRSAALAQYDICRRTMAQELGVEPAPETTRLYEQIRDGKLEHPPGVSSASRSLVRESRSVGVCPYRGLAAFQEADALFFFGREEFTGQLLDALGRQPMLAVVVGSSGCGKSSAVFAGLLPRLRDEANWLTAHFRPDGQPFHTLAAALLPLLEPELNETDRLIEVRKLADALREGEIPLYDAVERTLVKNGVANRLLFIIDQFEELYTLCRDSEERQRFLDGLLTAIEAGSEQRNSALALLLTLRADFMGHALAHRPFADALQDTSMMMGPMSRDELRRAIEIPAEMQGAVFEAGLVERLLDDVGEAPGNLPLLEFALTLLWEEQSDGWLTHAGYEEIGRVKGALARYADQVLAELDESEQEAARRIFVQLVRPGEGTEDTRRMATRAELMDENWELVRILADKRLIVTGQDATGKELVEVVHEALIRHWGQLRAWMDADRAFRIWQERLRTALRQWEASDRDEGALLRGALLAQAERWLTERETELSAAENAFIRVSVELRERRQTERERRQRHTILGLAGGLAIAVVLMILAFAARATAQREAAVNHSLVLASNAQHAQQNGEVDLALALALEAVSIDQPPPEAARTLSQVALGPGTRAVFEAHRSTVNAVAFSPDSTMALSGSCDELAPGGDCVEGALSLWDLDARIELRRLQGHTDWVDAVAFSPDGQTALSGSSDATLILWDIETGAVLHRLQGHTDGVNAVAFSSDGQMALSGSDDTTLILWDVTTGEAVLRFEGHTGNVNSLAFSPDAQTVISGADDTTLILWDVATGQAIRRFEGHTNETTGVAYNLDGATILSTGDHTLRLWKLETGELIRQQYFGGMPTLFAISPDGRTAVFELGGLRLWDIERWREVQWLLGGDAANTETESAALAPNGRLALSGSSDGSLRVWNLGGQVTFRYFETDGTPLAAVAASPDGRYLLTGDMADQVVLWDIRHGVAIRRFEGDAVAVSPNSVAFSPDGKYALIGSGDAFGSSGARSLVLWDVENGREIRRFEGHSEILRSVAFSPDGRTALAGSQGVVNDTGDLILWDIETGQQIRRFETTEDTTSIVFSADGNRVLTSSAYFPNVTLWDVATGKAIRRFEGHANMVFDVAFGPDETTALSASADGSLILWDVETGAIVRRYLGHDNMVWTLDVSPDGHYVMSGSEDGTLILWDLETGEGLRRFSGHAALATGLVFDPDGQTVFSVALDGALIQWQVSDLPLDELIAWTYDNRYVRDLSCDERAQYRIEPLCKDETDMPKSHPGP